MSEYKKYRTLCLNGKILKAEEILHYCENSGDEALGPVGPFMEEWMNEESFIKLTTSGSTGKPKVWQAEKDKMLFSASRTAKYFQFKRRQTALLCLPVAYIAGKMMIVRALFSGLNLICVRPDKNPLQYLDPQLNIDFAAMIPLQLQQILILENQSSLSKIKKLLLGGASLNRELETQVQTLSTQLFHGYGMTETLSHVALRRVNGKNASSAYQALDGIQLSADDRGCLMITAPGLLDKTLITNDLVRFTGSNEFVWEGRFDHVINSGGIKLLPERIEHKIQPVLKRRFYFTGIPDSTYGEKLILIIEGTRFDAEKLKSLKNNFSRLLTKYEVPKEIFFLNNFVETKNGKVNRSKTTAGIMG